MSGLAGATLTMVMRLQDHMQLWHLAGLHMVGVTCCESEKRTHVQTHVQSELHACEWAQVCLKQGPEGLTSALALGLVGPCP